MSSVRLSTTGAACVRGVGGRVGCQGCPVPVTCHSLPVTCTAAVCSSSATSRVHAGTAHPPLRVGTRTSCSAPATQRCQARRRRSNCQVLGWPESKGPPLGLVCYFMILSSQLGMRLRCVACLTRASSCARQSLARPLKASSHSQAVATCCCWVCPAVCKPSWAPSKPRLARWRCCVGHHFGPASQHII